MSHPLELEQVLMRHRRLNEDLWRDVDGLLWTVAARSRIYGDYQRRALEIECLDTDKFGQFHGIRDDAALLHHRGPLTLVHRSFEDEPEQDDEAAS